jgi:hypothetical protein
MKLFSTLKLVPKGDLALGCTIHKAKCPNDFPLWLVFINIISEIHHAVITLNIETLKSISIFKILCSLWLTL